MSAFKCEQTQYGFRWGPMKVERTVSDEKCGVVVTLQSEHRTVQVRFSPKGQRADVRLQSWKGAVVDEHIEG